MDKFFKLKENKTNVRTEIIAGITTFVTMAYIIFVNPNILGQAGMDQGAVMLATCIAAAVGTLLIGLLSNYPFAQAPGMGLNAFFAFTICGTLGYSWQAGLAAVFISGILFIIITVSGWRKAIVEAIPAFLKKAISGGIGLFIAYIGIKNSGLLKFVAEPGHYSFLPDASANIDSSAIPSFSFASPVAILSIIGLVIAALLVVKRVKGALLIGIVATSAIGIFMQFVLKFDVGIVKPESFKLASLGPTFGEFIHGFKDLIQTSEGVFATIVSIVSVLIALTLVDMFDTIGTLIGTANKAGFLDKDGNLPRIEKAMMADAVATSCGAVLGTSTVTTYVESSAGVAEGGKTGLTSVVTAVLFLIAIFASPFLHYIPASATSPILIIVGVMMMGSIKEIEWNNLEIAIPAFFTMAVMPFAYSIADGIACGIIFYVLVNLFTGKAKKTSIIMYIFALLFIIRYFIIMLPK